MLHSINTDQRLYVIKAGHGYSCLGFDVADKKTRAVLAWMGWPERPLPEPGTPDHWRAYWQAMELGAKHAAKTATRCPAELEPALIGLEGKRVEMTAPDGAKERFYVGKSTGWMPCHLAIKRRDSTGGCAVYLPEGATVRVVA